MMNKLLLSSLLSVCALSANATYYSGKLSFESYQDGGLTVTGFCEPPLLNEVIAIPEQVDGIKVMHIGYEAFSGSDISTVILPSNVADIKSRAFAYCTHLKAMEIPVTCTTVGEGAFQGCFELAALQCCAENIGKEAFKSCYALAEVDLAFTKYIEPGAFAYCHALTHIDIPESCLRIGSSYNDDAIGVFDHCEDLLTITFEYNLSDNSPCLKQIGCNTFRNCTNLGRLDLPYSVERIGKNAFYRCKDLKHIEWGGRYYTLNVESQDFTNVPVSRIVNHGNVQFENPADMQQLNTLLEVRYDKYATSVQSKLYKDCKYLREVHLDNVSSTGVQSFSGCTDLQELTFSNSVERISAGSFSGCTALKDFVLPDNLKIIETGAFSDCTSLREVNFNATLEEIWGDAFSGCTGIERLILPKSLTSLSSSSFNNCTSLKTIIMGGGQRYLSIKNFAPQSPVAVLTLRGNVGDGAMQWAETLKTLYFKDNHTKVGGNDFSGCTALENVDFSNIESIGRYAFSKCTSLKSVNLSTVKEIGEWAFSYCSSLESVELGQMITEIEEEIFYGTAITTLTIPDNVTTFKPSSHCNKLEAVYIGDGVTSVANFYACDNLKDIYLGKNVADVNISNTGLKKIYSANPVPPGGGRFNYQVYKNAVLTVPNGCASAYKVHDIWKDFYTINEGQYDSMESIASDTDANWVKVTNRCIGITDAQNADVHTIDGKHVCQIKTGEKSTALLPGIYIVVSGSRSQKVSIH